MNTKSFFMVAIGAFVLASCNLNQVDQTGLLTASVRDALNSPATLSIADEIESVEYIPLEMTNDDASLIDGVVDFAITSKYIYVLVGKEARIVLFDRQGHFLRTFLRQGQGPDDFNGMIGFIQADEADNRFYVIGNKVGAIAMPLMPFQNGSFGIGVFQEDGEAIITKNDFYSPLVPREDSGFTFGVMGSPSDGKQASVLFKTASNDTIYRLSADTIQPVLVAGLSNSDEEVIRGLNIRDIKRFPANGDIFVSDIFETPRRFYLRMMLNEKYYVASVDKHSGETVVEQCDIPETSAYNLADINMQLGMVGSKGHNRFPVWGRVLGNNLVQVVTPYEIETFKEQTQITVPQELQKRNANENPIFIIYKIK